MAFEVDDGQAWERAFGAASSPLLPAYVPRSPESTVLHRVVREHLTSFLEEARARSAHGFGLPGFVERESRHYLGCGVLARGFARSRCDSCSDEHLVGFSCKRRGVCPSCTSRRALDAAALLVGAVLPSVPMRQWVLSFPIKVRWVLAKKPALVGRALAIFQRALSTWQRLRGRVVGACGATGAVTFVQRSGSTWQLNLHFHVVTPDGVFVRGEDGGVSFQRLPAPDDDDVEALLRRCASRVLPKPPAPVLEDGLPLDKPRVRASPSPYRLDWAAALKRVHGVDVLKCARCGGSLVVLAAAMAGRFATSPSPPCGSSFIEKLSAVKVILDHLGLPSAPLPLGKARALHGRPRVASAARARGCCGPPQVAWGF